MFAIVATGGKQYKVAVGQTLDVERLDAPVGADVELERVLLVADGDQVRHGQPVVEGASVTAQVVRHDRGPKIIVFRYRSKSRYRRKTGHRQERTHLLIRSINS
ncbi:MAG: 50S ribosomal protein L21 [Chloroflexota bacterium]